MNLRSLVVVLILAATTAYATVSKLSREVRQSQIEGLLKENAFVNARVPQTTFVPETPSFLPDTEISAQTFQFDFSRLQQPRARGRTFRRILDLQDRIIKRGGCNRNICFALDASKNLRAIDFALQRDFIALIAATLTVDSDVNISAYEYAPGISRIWRLSRNINDFLLRLENLRQSRSRSTTFLDGAIDGCNRELRPFSSLDANKLVVIGNGKTRPFQERLVRRAADRFRRRTGAICAVAVEGANRELFSQISDKPDRVIDVTDVFRFDEILNEVVQNICNLS